MRTCRIYFPSDFAIYHAAVLAVAIMLYMTSHFTFTNNALMSEFIDTCMDTFFYYLIQAPN